MPKHRKHTPIVSEKQQGLMGAELGRRREGKQGRMKGTTTKELESHLHESKGKKLPKRIKKAAKGMVVDPVTGGMGPRRATGPAPAGPPQVIRTTKEALTGRRGDR